MLTASRFVVVVEPGGGAGQGHSPHRHELEHVHDDGDHHRHLHGPHEHGPVARRGSIRDQVSACGGRHGCGADQRPGGLVPGAVIGLPTSVGYDIAAVGTAAIHSSLASCLPGVTMMNIDNG